jgi:hypothetical protein
MEFAVSAIESAIEPAIKPATKPEIKPAPKRKRHSRIPTEENKELRRNVTRSMQHA